MREGEHQTLVRQIERGNRWQRMFLILVAMHTQTALPEATKTEWASEYEQVSLWLKMQEEKRMAYEDAWQGIQEAKDDQKSIENDTLQELEDDLFAARDSRKRLVCAFRQAKSDKDVAEGINLVCEAAIKALGAALLKKTNDLEQYEFVYKHDLKPFFAWAQSYLYAGRWAGHDLSDAIKTELLERDAELATARKDAAAMDYLRPEVRAFAKLMEDKLRANEHKGTWKTTDAFTLFARILDESGELYAALLRSPFDGASVAREAADVANFAMMVADVCGALDYLAEQGVIA